MNTNTHSAPMNTLASPTRRLLLRTLGVLGLTASCNAFPSEEAQAKKKRRKKKKPKNASPSPSPCLPASQMLTCQSKCGSVVNACGEAVDCGPCTGFKFVREWGDLHSFGSITVGNDGHIYVGETGSARILKFTKAGELVTTWGSHGDGNGQFWGSLPGLAVDNDGLIFVADGDNARVQVFEPDGTFVTKWGSRGSEDGQFWGWEMRGLALNRAGQVYVVDAGNNRIQKFTRDGEFITKWGGEGSGPGQFSAGINGITVGRDNFVYVTDTGNARVQKFTPDGDFVLAWGSKGNGDGEFGADRYEGVSGIAEGPDGSLFVADSVNSRIQQFTTDGDFVTKWGHYGELPGQFRSPVNVALDNSGSIYVADSGNFRIQVFAPWEGISAARRGPGRRAGRRPRS